jgi:hypothetical protein
MLCLHIERDITQRIRVAFLVQLYNVHVDNIYLQLKQRLAVSENRLAESESSRLSLQEDLDQCRRQYETEIFVLRTQVNIYDEDFKAIRRELDTTKAQLETAKMELGIARDTVSKAQLSILHICGLTLMHLVNCSESSNGVAIIVGRRKEFVI